MIKLRNIKIKHLWKIRSLSTTIIVNNFLKSEIYVSNSQLSIKYSKIQDKIKLCIMNILKIFFSSVLYI